MRLTIATILLGLALCASAAAQGSPRPFDGLTLLKDCNAPDQPQSTVEGLQVGYCYGFISAAATAIAHKNGINDSNRSAEQIVLIVKKYLYDHPETLDRPAYLLVEAALASPWQLDSDGAKVAALTNAIQDFGRPLRPEEPDFARFIQHQLGLPSCGN